VTGNCLIGCCDVTGNCLIGCCDVTDNQRHHIKLRRVHIATIIVYMVVDIDYTEDVNSIAIRLLVTVSYWYLRLH
jgi:hypothetical protein